MEISSEEFEKLKYIGEGEKGVVRQRGKYALKQFFELGSYKKVCLKPQYDTVSDVFAFPRQQLIIDGVYNGCINNFIVGKNIDNYKVDKFEEFISLIKTVELELKLISDRKITILYLLPRNALVTKDGFKVIDTTRYQITEYTYECLCTNIRRLNYFFINYMLLKDMDSSEFLKLVSTNDKLFAYFQSLTYVEAHTYLSRFLEHFMNEFNIESVNDYKKLVKRCI